MALLFASGSTCFLLGPFPGYLALLGEGADAITFFVGSLLFTAGGALQSTSAFPRRSERSGGRSLWWAAIVQSAGTLFFNRTTYKAMSTALANPHYDRLVWRPDALGSVCFLISGAIAYRASARRGWLPAHGARGWWEPAVNLLGCVFFALAAVAGRVVPSTGSVLSLAAANWNTSLGAACFLACALATLRSGRSSKFRRLHEMERTLGRDLERHIAHAPANAGPSSDAGDAGASTRGQASGGGARSSGSETPGAGPQLPDSLTS